MKAALGALKRLSPRAIWPSEAHDFTPWLAENIAKLGEVLGMDLEVSATEASVGDFAVDIRARDLATSREVVIENQYGATDHDHLGKLLTYASGVDATTLVWIAESIRDEHRQALEWLNERTDTDTMLFAIVLEVLQIDESAPAYNFRPIVFPNNWRKKTHGGGGTDVSPRAEAYRRFFQTLIDELRDAHKFTSVRVAGAQSWCSFSSGVSGVSYGASFALGGRARVEVYIDRGDANENKGLFDWLVSRKQPIEAEIGCPLEWERLDERRASRVAVYRSGAIDADDSSLADIRKWMVGNLLSLKRAVGPLLKQYGKHDG